MYGRTLPSVQRHLFRQLVQASLALRAQGFVYLDFRGENVLIDDALRLKLVDFGMSQRILPPPPVMPTASTSSSQKVTYEVYEQYGTREASAPEILMGKGYRGPEADVWAMGLILFLIATGGDEAFKSEADAISGNVPVVSDVDSDCMELIRRMLTVDPDQRATLDEVAAHRWLNTAT
ncbi:hypothetical protein HK104_006264 [Borealophlyctis nickersoniae]|nr:hypothetical protein HK104_006264 [Borealophlyctis nickersoniae]